MNDDEDSFVVDGVDVQRHEDGEHVRLVFRDSDARRAVIVHRDNLPQLLMELQREIGAKHAVPIDRGSLAFGTTYQLEGYGVQKRPDGGARLTLYVKLPDQGRTVTLALPLTQEDVKEIISHLTSES